MPPTLVPTLIADVAQQCLAPCPACGAVVLVHVWHHSTTTTPGHFSRYEQPRTPVCGEMHRCGTPKLVDTRLLDD